MSTFPGSLLVSTFTPALRDIESGKVLKLAGHAAPRCDSGGRVVLPFRRSRSDASAPVAQGIEHRPPEAGAEVRILAGAPDLEA